MIIKWNVRYEEIKEFSLYIMKEIRNWSINESFENGVNLLKRLHQSILKIFGHMEKMS